MTELSRLNYGTNAPMVNREEKARIRREVQVSLAFAHGFNAQGKTAWQLLDYIVEHGIPPRAERETAVAKSREPID